MPIKVPRKPADAYQHGNLRAALIQAGLKLLAEGGVPNLSLRAAAQLAGVSHAAPYRHFADKDALVAAIAEEGFRLLTVSMQRALEGLDAAPILPRFRALGLGYVRFAMAHPAHLRVMFGGMIDDRRATEAVHAAGKEAYGLLHATVAEGLARGELRGPDADTVAAAAWSMVHGLSMLLIDGALQRPGKPAPDGDTITPLLLHLLEEGIAAPARGRSRG